MELLSTKDLQDVIRKRIAPKTFLKDMFFGKEKTFITEKIEVQTKKSRRIMAPFVAPVDKGVVVKSQGWSATTLTPFNIKVITETSAADMLKVGFGENEYSDKNPVQRAMEKQMDEMIDLDQTITRRKEWLCAQILYTGKCVVEVEDGKGAKKHKYQLDFTLTNKETLTSIKKWNAESADVMGDLERWYTAIQEKSGIVPTYVILEPSVVPYYIKAVAELLDNRRVEMGSVAPRVLPNGARYVGYYAPLNLDIYSYQEKYEDSEGNLQPIVPTGSVLMGSNIHQISYGAICFFEGSQKKVFEGAYPLIRHFVNEKEDMEEIQMQTKPLPVLHDVDSIYVATVL